MKSAGARGLAAEAVAAVIARGVSLDQALAAVLPRLSKPADAGLLKELCFGTLRWRLRLEAPLKTLLKRPLKARDADIHALLLIGLYQLAHMRVPDHAAVGETVAAVSGLGKHWARGLVNATLRNFLRRQDELLAAADTAPASRYAHPRWLIDRLRADWPDDWEATLAANNTRPPMTLRVNRRRTNREQMQARLAAAGIEAEPHPLAADALTLVSPVDVERLPGFAAGDLSVQDAGAQFAAEALDCGPGMRVLDACAAPGGKTGHLLERWPNLAECVALDASASRLDRVRENLDRLDFRATVLEGDARRPADWWDGQPFDRILLDAPCSGSGVIRRHPDIKSLRRAADIDRLAGVQAALLDALWPLLASGGKLVYATCSVLRAENEVQIANFLARDAGARAVALPADPFDAGSRAAGAGRQILPGDSGMDGFYYACLEKIVDDK
ncbi:MAG TPA: 16S rRNA (cytosine(967)-C(5))-methyltransferase RsmB [Gammaproteobacteria bacterium]|nr:16S rRNA (cytosine(967)-C(5))-methyltransferase RsmB [Gammaproteobacteria bacterium]